jgi:hypothetical protein
MLRTWILILITLVVASCLKQEEPQLKSEIQVTGQERAQLNACTDYRPFQNQLSKENTIKLFECNRWNDQYPNIYREVKEIAKNDWEKVFNPLDQTFFNQQDGRIKLFKILKNLKEKNALTDIGLIGEKFFQSPIPKVIAQLPESEIANILELLELKEEKRQIIYEFSILFRNLALKNEKLLEGEMYKTFKLQGINYFKSWIFNFLAKKFIEGKLEKDLLIFASMFDSEESNPNWVSKWAKDSENSYKKFIKIFEYSGVKNQSLNSDIKYLYQTLVQDVVCYNKEDQNKIFVGKEVADIVGFLIKNPQEDFLLKQLDHKTKLITFANLCDQIEVNQIETKNFISTYDRLFNHVQEFFQDPIQYDWIQGLHYQINQIAPEDKFYFIRFMQGDFYGKVEELSRFFNKNNSYGFYEFYFQILKDIPNKDYKKVYNFIKLIHDPELKNSLKTLAKVFLELRDEEKESLYDLVELILKPNFKNIEIVEESISLFKNYSGLSQTLGESYAFENKVETAKSLKILASHFSKSNLKDELSRFYGPDHMIKVIMALTNGLNELPVHENSSLFSDILDETFIINRNEYQMQKYNSCIEDIKKLEQKGAQYYDLIVLYPDSCKEIENGSLTHQMFIWFNSIEKTYGQLYGKNYHLFDAQGILRKESLQEIVIVLHTLHESSEIKNPKLLIQKISERLIHQGFYKSIESILDVVSLFYNNKEETKRFNNHLVSKFVNTSDDAIKEFLKPSASLFLKQTFKPERKNLKDCKVLENRIGVNPCLSKAELKQGMHKLLNIVFRKFDGANPMLEELISLMHPEGGIEIPYPEKGKIKKHIITFEEIVRFFYHMTKEGESKPISMMTPNTSGIYDLSTLVQLEVVIRDISFLNDFYGSFFKNTVAGAKKYQDKVVNLKKQVKLMHASGDFLRKANVFPPSSEWQLNNVLGTYDSLARVDDQFELNGNYYQYGPMMQSILVLVAKTSHPDAQNFTAFWFPNERIGDMHNGLFLTEFVKMSGMQHLAQFFNNRHQGDLNKFLNTPTFRRLNDQLFRMVPLKTMQSQLRELVDTYAKNDQDIIYQMVDDLIDWLYDLNDEERELVESYLVNVLESLTYADKNSLEQFFPLIKSAIENYALIKSHFPQDVKLINLLRESFSLSKNLVTLVQNNPNWIQNLVKIAKAFAIDQEKLGLKLFESQLKSNPKQTVTKIVYAVDALSKSVQTMSSEEVSEIVRGIERWSVNPKLNFKGIKLWAQETIKSGSHENEFLRIAHFLTQTLQYKGEKRSYFYVMLDKLLIEKEGEFSDLLNTCLGAIRL